MISLDHGGESWGDLDEHEEERNGLDACPGQVASLLAVWWNDDEEVEEKTINIAGSSTVFPVASAWGQAYSDANSEYTVTVAGGGLVLVHPRCAAQADSVHIGDMSRDWKSSNERRGWFHIQVY